METYRRIVCPQAMNGFLLESGDSWITKIYNLCGGNNFGPELNNPTKYIGCLGGIIGINHYEGLKTGSIQLICKDGTPTDTVGKSTAEGSMKTFTCPQGQLVNAFSGVSDKEGIRSLAFECMDPSKTSNSASTAEVSSKTSLWVLWVL